MRRALNKAGALTCRHYHKSVTFYEKFTEIVPALGESITEGSISSWSKSIGDKVEIDDVVAIVETDKVTVDLKATKAGILIQTFAEDDNVIVGQPLYVIDTEGIATSTSSSAESSTTVMSAPASSELAKPSHSARVPSIHFLGKRSLLVNKTPENLKTAPITSIPTIHSSMPVPAPPQFVSGYSANEIPTKPQTGVEFNSLEGKGWYGRPRISLEEMEAIESGGASVEDIKSKLPTWA